RQWGPGRDRHRPARPGGRPHRRLRRGDPHGCLRGRAVPGYRLQARRIRGPARPEALAGADLRPGRHAGVPAFGRRPGDAAERGAAGRRPAAVAAARARFERDLPAVPPEAARVVDPVTPEPVTSGRLEALAKEARDRALLWDAEGR